MTVYAFTGHRPKDLPADFGFRQVTQAVAAHIPRGQGHEFIVGGALGIDSWVAEYAFEYMIPYHLYLPFGPEVMSRFWPEQAQKRLNRHIKHAASFHVLSWGGYDVAMYQKRNIAMVNAANEVIAFWTGKQFGGTANCIRYAESVGKQVTNLLPK